ncbi:MAG: Membrane protein insertase YidC [Verrucomicrobiales bacterium]|nr:Membrane protein insertase YidC [Verrucomicrobiales bacterium]
MDRKSLTILIVAVALLFLLSPLVDKMYPPVPRKPGMTNQVASVTNETTSTSNTAAAATTTTSAPATATPSGPEKTLSVTNNSLICHFTSRGGGIGLIELIDYRAAIDCSRNLPGETNFANLNNQSRLPVLAISGAESITGDNNYTLVERGDSVIAEKVLPNGLRITKQFQMVSNYLFTAKLRIENTKGTPLLLPETQVTVGTATAMAPTDDPTTVGVFWYNGKKADEVTDKYFANRTLGCIPGTPRSDYENGAGNVDWTAVHNQFFTLAAIPEQPALQVRIHKYELPRIETTNAAASTLNSGYETALFYAPTNLPANGAIERTYTFYAGPKEYNRLAQYGQKFNNNLDLIMGFSGFFGFFSKLLLLSMNGLNAIGLQYGLCIIAITVILKVLFWPLTHASTKSAKRMQALMPQIKVIQDKYKDDAVKKNQKTMEFYKEHRVNPLGGCLPMLLQIPVFIGFYWMLRSAIELRGVHFLWACDLSQPDTIGHIAGFPVNIMPLIMGVTMLWQSHLTPPSPGMDPSQQKIMRYMPLMFMFILYKMSAGLTLYWTINNLLTIAQTKLTKATEPPTATAVSVAPRKRK